MVRPNENLRFDSLATFDPNRGRLFSLTNSLKLRGRSDSALDIVARYDPNQGKISSLNSQFDVPLNSHWRLSALLRYNGFTGKLDSTNLQLLHRWDCMEATITYSENPLGFNGGRQIFFNLRLLAFPSSHGFARGPGGDALGTGLGALY